MTKINDNFLKLQNNYLFANISQKVAEFKKNNPEKKIIRLGIGDVTQPLAPAVVDAMHKAVDEMSKQITFKGYGSEKGYDFLRQAILENDFKPRNVELDIDDIFISDGAKSDIGNIGDIFDKDNIVCMTDPIYPVYIDSNVMSGRSGDFINGKWNQIHYLSCNKSNNFIPSFPQEKVDLIYLCYPNNPTGTVITKEELKKWVDYAIQNKSIILYDTAYEAYIREENVVHSIYEIEGAKKCAIEFHSYSKTAGFTGVRCGYTIVPKELIVEVNGQDVHLNQLWDRRQCTKYNGTSYITQRGAEAIYTEEGKKQIAETINYYMENARIIRETIIDSGLEAFGGINAPYIWFKTPNNEKSWDFFERMLHEVSIVSTPGVGFGPSGEGYIRLTAFGEREDCLEAMKRLREWF